MKRFYIPLMFLLCGLGQVRGGIVMNPENGHHYDYVRSAMNWAAANAAATASSYNGVQGHLATITSASENLFITNAFGGTTIDMLWIGGYQPAGSPEPAGGWSWVTGESFVYDNWFPPSEPNNLGDQDRIMFAHLVLDDGKAWDDFIGGNNGAGYVVEYDTPLPPSVPEPSSVTLLLAGALGFGCHRWRKTAVRQSACQSFRRFLLVLLVLNFNVTVGKSGIVVNSYDPAVFDQNTAATDAALDISGFAIEDFEDTTQRTGLTYGFGCPASGPFTSLPATFNGIGVAQSPSPFQTLFVTTRARTDSGSTETASLYDSSSPLRWLGGNQLSSNYFERGEQQARHRPG